MKFLPLSRPSITEADISAVADVLRSGWITTGPKCAELETAFREKMGCTHAVALSSATAGMHLLLNSLDIGPGDEVITPSMTWVSTVNMITLRGATPVFVDVDRDTLMTTAALVEPHINSRTKMIIPVHIAGAALDLDPLRMLADEHGVSLAEDAAHAVGAFYRNEPIGRRGTGIFSFHPIKNITTGEGGLLFTDNAALAERVRRLRFHGLGADAFDRQSHGRAPQAEVLEPGFKYNLPDMNAVLGNHQLARLDELNNRRAVLANRYREQLAEVEEILPLAVPEYPMVHCWHLFIVRVDIDKAGMTRDDFMLALTQRGIGSGLHFRAVHLHKFYRDTLNIPAGRLPATEWNSDRICSLPLFPDMRLEDVDRAVDTIKTILGRT